MVRPALSCRFLCFLLMASAPALPAGVVKWKDANGVMHFGDSAPPGVNAENVRVAPAPPPPPVPAAQAPASKPPEKFRSIADETAAHNAEVLRRNAQGLAALGAAQRATAARNDKDVVEQCRAARGTNCNDGANAIRQQNYQHELAQQAAQSDAAMRSGRAVPESQRIKPTAPCQYPQTCAPK